MKDIGGGGGVGCGLLPAYVTHLRRGTEAFLPLRRRSQRSEVRVQVQVVEIINMNSEFHQLSQCNQQSSGSFGVSEVEAK